MTAELKIEARRGRENWVASAFLTL